MTDHLINELAGRAAGELVTQYLNTVDRGELARLAELRALELVRQTREILDDDILDDSTCFLRIDAMVTAFQEAGVSTRRHWECDC